MSDELPIFETPRGGRYLKLPERKVPHTEQSDSQLLRHIAERLDEIAERTAKVETELLGKEGDRSGGLVFRLGKIEQQLSLLWWIASTAAIAAIGLIVTKLTGIIGLK